MKWKLFTVAVLAGLFAACKGDTFNTKPTLKLNDISGNVVPQNGSLTINFEFTDKEGDVNDTLYIRKVRKNRRVVTTLRDTFALRVPDFPKQRKGTIEVSLAYQNYLISAANPPATGNPPRAESDTLLFRFVLKDKKNNTSDTVNIDNVIILR